LEQLKNAFYKRIVHLKENNLTDKSNQNLLEINHKKQKPSTITQKGSGINTKIKKTIFIN
jgi:hypothetical protein